MAFGGSGHPADMFGAPRELVRGDPVAGTPALRDPPKPKGKPKEKPMGKL